MQMEGVRVFSPDEWLASGLDATSYAAMDLKKSLEGLACHLFGNSYVVSACAFFFGWSYRISNWLMVVKCNIH